jgi:hypothetical protein
MYNCLCTPNVIANRPRGELLTDGVQLVAKKAATYFLENGGKHPLLRLLF